MITNLGVMTYGSTLGPSNRTGRGSSKAGPHALSHVAGDGGRSYPYDANGNMTNIDSLACSWDFKDRMVAAENDKMSARYTYDYTDRRIRKEVTSKSSHSSSLVSRPDVTLYINKYYEHRPNESAVKYV